ncbi:MAG: oligosaccharide flippase family protein [candidate division KSB1 bacterium]|nr:oligosaccharide flippase family protein [candidate division KSB1 bacterium]MDZ7365427.1 oligosaccharide flippase family protein [candidate division KSB1 bacterium]MDZ7403526.1 oligosaccharide flippase family protein [candidate division KSB1 bacterium]
MLRQLLKDSSFFSASRYLILGLGFARNVLIAKFLSPAEYGVWVIIMLVLIYGDQVHCGLRHLGDKEIPFRRGRGETTAELANNILGGVLLFSVIAFFLLVIFVAVTSGRSDGAKIIFLIAGSIIIADQVNRFYYMIMRAHHEFVLTSKIESSSELLRTLLLIAGVIFFALPGALIGMAASALLMAIYLSWRYRAAYRPRWHWQTLKTLVPMSLPLFINGLLFILLTNLDRLAAAMALSSHDLGLYGLAALLVAVPFNAVQAVGFVIYPRLSEQFGRHGDVKEVTPFFSKILTMTIYLAPLLVTTVFLAAPAVITGFLPAYAEAIPAVLILLPGAYFFTIVQLPTSFLVATENNRRFIIIEAVVILIAASSFLAGLKIAPTIITVAIVTAAGFFLFATLLLLVCYKTAEYPPSALVKIMLKLYAPFFFSIAILLILFKRFPYPLEGAFQQSLIWSLRQWLFFVISYGILWFWFMQRHGYWSRLRMELL